MCRLIVKRAFINVTWPKFALKTSSPPRSSPGRSWPGQKLACSPKAKSMGHGWNYLVQNPDIKAKKKHKRKEKTTATQIIRTESKTATAAVEAAN